MPTIAHAPIDRVVIGVDTHRDIHVAVALDGLGRKLDCLAVPTSTTGYAELLEWAQCLGEIEAWGVEGTGSYGAGLAQFLAGEDQLVIEVVRPNRQTRRRKGTSDPTDAEAAARAVLAGEATGSPKAGNDLVEMIRVLRIARSSAIKARTQAINVLRALVITAPPELRQRLADLTTTALLDNAGALRPGQQRTVLAHTKMALRSAAQRCGIESLARSRRPPRRTHQRGRPRTVGALRRWSRHRRSVARRGRRQPLSTAIRSGFRHALRRRSPTGVSGQTTNPHWLNRGGDRQANTALYRIVLVRMRWDPKTKHYVERRTKEGKSKKEIIRCLKRYVAREIYTVLTAGTSRRS